MLRAARLAAAFSVAALILSLLGALGVSGVAALAGTDLPATVVLALAVSGPALAALLFALKEGKGQMSALVRRIGSPPSVPLIALLVPTYAAAAIMGAWLSGGQFAVFDARSFMLGFAAQLFVVALLEEIGWRGYLLPRLMDWVTPLAASLLVAAAWFAWHLPKFGIGPLFVALLLIGCVANTLIMAVMIGDRRWGLWSCILLHGCYNLSQVVIDPDTSSMQAQYGAFMGVLTVSAIVAGYLLATRREWFRSPPVSIAPAMQGR